jgi:hypothetical protein
MHKQSHVEFIALPGFTLLLAKRNAGHEKRLKKSRKDEVEM